MLPRAPSSTLFPYTTLFRSIRKPNPIPGWFEFHEVFHMGTVIGYACHVVAIYLVVCAL